MVLYEVNFEIPKQHYQEFTRLFDKHMDDGVNSDPKGFQFAGRWLRENKYENRSEDVVLVTAHYYLRDRAALQHYFDVNADKVRAKFLDPIKDKIPLVVTRRILLADVESGHPPKLPR